MDKRYVAADGAEITDGAEMFNYYDRVPVTIRIAGTQADPTSEFHKHWDGWFNTSGAVLNGERLCSLETARARGWVTP